MKQVTFDIPAFSPEVHEILLGHAIALGYVVVPKKEQALSAIDNLELLLYPFDIPEGRTIASCKINVPMSDHCKQYLTNKNFDTVTPKGPIAGGFHDMKAHFESDDGVKAIQKFAKQTGRKLRVGTALELLLFWGQKRVHCPKCFVALGSVWDGKVLYWYGDCADFRLDHWVGKWNERYQVFLVEDLEPLPTPS